MTNYTIPSAYQADLQVSSADAHPLADVQQILEMLDSYRPVNSEKNIWAFWHSGLSTMPEWCQRNVIDWVRICGTTGWTVRVLNNLPTSPNYALKYLGEDILPETFVRRTMDGPYSGPYSADLLRGACLLQHGGVFMDVGNILIRHMDRICWDKIEDQNTPYNVAVPTNSISLGTLLDQPDNIGKDQEEGTFFGLLGYGTVHFRQTRTSIATMKAEKSRTLMKKGVLEP